MRKFLAGVSAAALCVAIEGAACAQVEEIVITATKRSEKAQNVPVAVNAIDGQQLKQLGVSSFTDYLVQFPNITSGGGGPGQSTIYIRGVASTTPNLLVAGVAGLAPNVALYLDEQPLSQPGRNLDVYATDLERIEVLPGPQGTLFGASSQAGTVRLITAKPKLNKYEGFANGGVSTTQGGAASYKAEGGVNLPIGKSAAIRVVGYYDHAGGYIDNVLGTRDMRASARFRPATARRENGTLVGPVRAGFQAGADLSGVNFLTANNSSLVEKNFNDTNYKGFRASGRVELAPGWSALVGYAKQWIDSDGVFQEDPDLGHYKIDRYSPDRLKDNFDNVNWTLEGRLGALDMLYTGAYTKRDIHQRVDYADYLYIAQYLPYYLCDSSVSYPGTARPSGTCQAPSAAVQSRSKTRVFTHEFRVNTPAGERFRVTAGGFYSNLRLDERNDFNYSNNVFANIFGARGFSPNFPFKTGYTSDSGPFAPQTIFRNDIRRTDKQWGIFGEASYEIIPHDLTLTVGSRYYDVRVGLEGSANSSFCNGGGAADSNSFGTDVSDLYNGDGRYTYINTCDVSRHKTYTLSQSLADIRAADPQLSLAQATAIFNAVRAPSKAKSTGAIVKVNLSYKPSDGLLFYGTFSQGYRPGLLNRPGGRISPAGNFVVPFVVDTDKLNNYELGWKTNLLQRQLQVNGNVFYNQIKNLQTTILDQSITNLTFSANAANARVIGFEGDVIWAPIALRGLTVSGSVSLLDTKITKVIVPTGDVTKGSSLAFAPHFQGNVRVRYEWALSTNLDAHLQASATHASSSRSDIINNTAVHVPGWWMGTLAAGVSTRSWSAELFANNVTNSHAVLAATGVNDVNRYTPARPREIGLRVGYKF